MHVCPPPILPRVLRGFHKAAIALAFWTVAAAAQAEAKWDLACGVSGHATSIPKTSCSLPPTSTRRRAGS